MKRRISSVAMRWIALVMVFCLALPTSSVPVFAIEADTEDVSVSANRMVATEEEDVDAEEAVLDTAYQLPYGEETTLTNLKPVQNYRVLVTIPEEEEGDESSDYYRLTVDGKTVSYMNAYVADSNVYWGFGIAYMQPGTYEISVLNDFETEHTVCIEKANITSVTAALNNEQYILNSEKNLEADGMDVTITFDDDSTETWNTNDFKSTCYMVYNQTSWDKETGVDKSELVVGNKYTAVYNILGCSDIEVSYSVVENVLTSIAFKNDSVVNTLYEDSSKYEYTWLNLNDNEVFVVTESGETKEYTYKELKAKYGITLGIFYNGENYSASYIENGSKMTYVKDIVNLKGIEDDNNITAYAMIGSSYCDFTVQLVRNPIESISINSLPKTTYVKGTKNISYAGLELLVNYDDGTSKVLSYDNGDFTENYYSLEGRFENGTGLAYLEAGEYVYIYTYAGVSVSTIITVEESNVREISVIDGANNFEFEAGEKVQLPYGIDLTLQFTYADGSQSTAVYACNSWNDEVLYYENKSNTNDKFELLYTEVDFDKKGSYTAYIDYMGVQAEVPVEITESNIENVSVDFSNTENIYIYGTDNYTSNVKFKVHVDYKDGESKTYDSSDVSKKAYFYYQNESGNWNKSETTSVLPLGQHTLYVKVFGETFEHEITVIENPVKSVTIIEGETQTFIKGESRSATGTGISLLVSYKDESIGDKIVQIEDPWNTWEDEDYPGKSPDYMYSGVFIQNYSTNQVNSLAVGTYDAKFRAYGINLTHKVVIKESPVESISVSLGEGYDTYIVGDDFWLSPSDMKMALTVTYSDDAIGTKFIDLSEGEYWEDEDYSSNGASISYKRIKKDGEIILYDAANASNFAVGTYEYVVGAYGKEASVTFNIIESPVASVAYEPENTTFQEGSVYIDTSTGIVRVTYKDGTTAEFDNDNGWVDTKVGAARRQLVGSCYAKDDKGNKVSDLNTLTAGTHAIYVVIYGIETSFDVVVTENPIKSIEVVEATNKFVEGTNKSLMDIIKKVRYNMVDDVSVEYEVSWGYIEDLDVEFEDVYVEYNDERCGNVENLELGTYTVIAEIQGKKARFTIEVVENPVESISVSVPEDKKSFLVYSYEELSNVGYEITVNYADSAIKDKTVVCDGSYSWEDENFPGGEVSFSQYILYEVDGEEDRTDCINSDIGLGTYTVVVEAYGCKTNFEIEIVAPDVTAISLNAEDWKKTYCANSKESLTYKVQDITVTFADGTSKRLYDIVYEEYTWNGILLSGPTDLHSTYMNSLKQYLVNADGEKVQYYDDLKGFEAGTYEVIFDLFGCEASYEIELEASNVETFEIATPPTMNKYLDINSDILSYEGMQLAITYNDGTPSKTVSMNDCYDPDMGRYYIDGERVYFSEDYDWDNGEMTATLSYKDKDVSYKFTRGLPDLDLATSIKADGSVLTRIVKNNDFGYYKFEPEESGTYYIYTTGNMHTYGAIFREDGDYIDDRDWGGDGDNYRLEVELDEGETYYIISKLAEYNEIGNFATVISKQEKLVVKEKQKIADVKLKIDNPKAGGKKPKWHEVKDDSKSDSYVITNVTWTESEDMDQNGKFKPGKSYEVEIVLTPLDNYKFTTETKISVNTKRPTYRRIGSDGTLTLRFAFGNTKYKVNVPESEDYDIEFDANNPEYYGDGDHCRFKISPKKDGKRVVVKRNGTIIKPNEEGYYEIGDFDANVDVAVSVTEPEVTEDTVFVNYYDGEELYDQIVVTKDKSIFEGSEEKNLPQLENYADGSNQFFLGWYTQDGTRYTKNTKIEKETTLYSKWTTGIFKQKSGKMVVTYKMISVTESGKIRLQVSSVKAEEASVARETISFLADLINPDRADEGAFVIPSEADLTDIAEDMESEVVSVAESAFEGNTDITSVTIPSTVESIGANAFSGCTSLTEVSMEDGVKEIGDSAFDGCTGLEEVKLPETVTSIGESAFKDSGITQITIPDSVESIGTDAFAKTASDGEEQKEVEVLCSTYMKEQMSEEIENAGAKVIKFELTINHEFDEIAVGYKGDTITVSANAIKNDEDISDKITWSMEEDGEEWITITDKGDGYVEITPVKATNESVKLTASCEGAKKELYVKVTRKTVSHDDIVITLDKEIYEYEGMDINPVVESVTVCDETIPEDEYQCMNYLFLEQERGRLEVIFDNYYVEEYQGNSIVVYYSIKLPEVEGVSISYTSLDMLVGAEQTLTASVVPNYVLNSGICWETDNENVATVENGKIVAKAVGKATITARSLMDLTKSASCVVTVKEKEQEKDEGVAVKPSHTCTWTDGPVVKASLNKNGSISQTCKGCGAVKQKSVIYAPQKVDLSSAECTYNNKEQKPSVKVLDSQGAEITASNYTVTYSNNKNIGKATVTVTFKGDKYEGSMKQTFNINPVKTKISKAKAAKKKITVTWKKVKKNITGYQIQYSTSSDFKKAKTVTVKGAKKTSKTISKLKSKKKYYVRVRTYKTVNGTKYYSEWSKAKKVKVK